MPYQKALSIANDISNNMKRANNLVKHEIK